MPRKIKPKPLRERDVAALLSSLDDYRAVIAAGKVQRWDVVKWAVTLNLAFATVSVIWDQKTPGLFAPRTIFFALASAVMVAAVALVAHYNWRMTGARDISEKFQTKLAEDCIAVRKVEDDPREPKGFWCDLLELLTFPALIFLSWVSIAILFCMSILGPAEARPTYFSL